MDVVISDDTLVAIIRQIDCGSLFKTFRLVSRKWRKLTDQVHPTGDEKFADNAATIYYMKRLADRSEVLRWIFNHNTEINAPMIKKLSAKSIFQLYFTWRYSSNNKNTIAKFIPTLIWVDGVVRLTDESFDVILNSNNCTWKFPQIYNHSQRIDNPKDHRFDGTCTGVPWPITRAFIEKFTDIDGVNLYELYPDHWKELIELKYYCGLGKVASMDLLVKLENIISSPLKSGETLKNPFARKTIFTQIYENPNLTLEYVLRWNLNPSLMKNLTMQMINDHPEIDWISDAFYNIKITDENIDAILNHPLLNETILLVNKCEFRFARRIADKLKNNDIKKANQLLNFSYIDVIMDKINFNEFETALPPDWNGQLKTLPWKLTHYLLAEDDLVASL